MDRNVFGAQQILPSMWRRQVLRLWCLIHLSLQVFRLTSVEGYPVIVVTHGGRAVLPCELPEYDDTSRLYIVWTLTPMSVDHHPFQIILYQDGKIINMPWNLGSRVTFLTDPTTSGSISIERIEGGDDGVYQCLVVNPLQSPQSLIQLVNLSVLEKPSLPRCRMEGALELGGSITLICSSNIGNPKPQYSWWKMESNRNIPLSLFQIHGQIFLHNVSGETSALYICVSSNSLGSNSCSILLKLEIFEQAENTLAVGVSVAMAMALILLVLFGLVLCLHWENRRQRWRAAREKQETCIPEDLDAPPSRPPAPQRTL
ncbi:immunoglobulin superfamily member 11-like isoform X2 [Cetorhinus maximus]